MVNELYTLAGTVIIAASTVYTSRAGERARVAEERRLAAEREAEREELKEHAEAQGLRDERQHVIENLERLNQRLQAIVDKQDEACQMLGMTFSDMVIFIKNHQRK